MIELPTRTDAFIILALGTWVLGAFVMAVIIAIGMFQHGRWEFELGMALAILILAGAVVLRGWLWNLRGVEVLEISTKGLRIRKEGSFWMPVFDIRTEDMDGITAEEYVWFRASFLYRISGGPIRIGYLGRAYCIGDKRSVKEAEPIVERLRALLKEARRIHMEDLRD